MIIGGFDSQGRPYVQGRLIILRLGVEGYIDFLVDTGADSTSIHPLDGSCLNVPFDMLRNEASYGGIGGTLSYFTEPAFLLFDDGTRLRVYILEISIAKPSAEIDTLPSLLGRPLLNNWRMWHDPWGNRLEIVAKNADLTVRGDVADIPSFSSS